jgi:hypothetical protein
VTAPPITPVQCKAARRLVGWNVLDLARTAATEPLELSRFEGRHGMLSLGKLAARPAGLRGRWRRVRARHASPARRATMTATAILDLEKAGFSREQVEALARWHEAGIDLSHLANPVCGFSSRKVVEGTPVAPARSSRRHCRSEGRPWTWRP